MLFHFSSGQLVVLAPRAGTRSGAMIGSSRSSCGAMKNLDDDDEKFVYTYATVKPNEMDFL